MPKELTRAMFRVVIPGLFAGGLCGAAIAVSLVPPGWGIAAAVAIALYIGLSVLRVKRRFKQAS